jgi:hypothetical protein
VTAWLGREGHRVILFSMFLFTLVETGGKDGVPIVTIPAG